MLPTLIFKCIFPLTSVCSLISCYNGSKNWKSCNSSLQRNPLGQEFAKKFEKDAKLPCLPKIAIARADFAQHLTLISSLLSIFCKNMKGEENLLSIKKMSAFYIKKVFLCHKLTKPRSNNYFLCKSKSTSS